MTLLSETLLDLELQPRAGAHAMALSEALLDLELQPRAQEATS